MATLFGLCFLNFVTSQAPTPSEERRGSCEPFDMNLLSGSRADGSLIALSRGFPSNEIVVVIEAKVTCESPGTIRNKVSSVTLTTIFGCMDGSCSESTDQFSYHCDRVTQSYVPANSNLENSQNVESAPVAEPGRCGRCSSVPSSQSGCIGTYLLVPVNVLDAQPHLLHSPQMQSRKHAPSLLNRLNLNSSKLGVLIKFLHKYRASAAPVT